MRSRKLLALIIHGQVVLLYTKYIYISRSVYPSIQVTYCVVDNNKAERGFGPLARAQIDQKHE